MARRKTGTKVTFVISEDMLKLADLHADEVGSDRYAVLRDAIAKGLLTLRIEHEVAKNPDRYARDLIAAMQGSEVAGASVRNKLEDDLVEGVRSRIEGSGAA